jgi:Zn-dependent alcohol dehydrogenase
MKTVQANYRNFPLAKCATHQYKLADAQKALEAVDTGEVIKAVIFPQGIAK